MARQLRQLQTAVSSKKIGNKADQAIVDHITSNYSVTSAQARAIVSKVNNFAKNNPGVGTADKAGLMLQKATAKLPKKSK